MRIIRALGFLAIATLAVTSVAAYAPAQAMAAGAAAVIVAAPGTQVNAGTQFTVDITVQPNNDIAGVQFNLSFNPSLATVNSVSEGNLLRQGGASTYFMAGQINNAAGTLSNVAGAITTPGQTVSGAGTFVSISMTAKNVTGTCPLNISNVIVGNISGQAVAISTANGQVVVVRTGNNPPVLAPIGNKSVTAGQPLQFTISATDPDSDSLTYSASNLPAGASFNASGAAFSWTPTASQVGTYSGVHFQVSDGSLVASENITITVNASPPVGGGGGLGGGGGGGGGGVPPNPGVTSIGIYTNGEGLFNLAAIITSEDSKAQLEIAKGVQANAKDGSSLRYVSISKAADAAAPSDDSVLVEAAYDFGPDGATFSPAVTVIFVYDASLMPAGVTESSLFIANWDATANKWVEIASTVDAASHTVRATISRLSRYALMGHVQAQTPAPTPAATTAAQPPPTTQAIVPPVSAAPEVRISLFEAVPSYGQANQINSVGITYGLSNSAGQPTDARLVLRVGLDGKSLEQLELLSGTIGPSNSGTWDYVPSAGWTAGAYSFRVELYEGTALVDSSSEASVLVAAKRAAVISWNILLIIIGGAALASCVTTVLVLRRRRALLSSWSAKNGR